MMTEVERLTLEIANLTKLVEHGETLDCTPEDRAKHLDTMVILTKHLFTLQKKPLSDPVIVSMQAALAAAERSLGPVIASPQVSEPVPLSSTSRPSTLSAVEFPKDGRIYRIGNPFVDSGTPIPNLTAVPFVGSGFGSYSQNVHFTNTPNNDLRVHWKFTLVQDGMFRISNPFYQNDHEYTPERYFLNRNGGSSGFVNAMGMADSESAIWRVRYVGGAFNICNPEKPRSMIHVRTSVAYFVFHGPPHDFGAGDVQLFEVD